MRTSFHLIPIICFGVYFSSVSAITLKKVGNTGYAAVVDVSDIAIKKMDNGYVYIKANGYLPDGVIGRPALPQKMFRLAIGTGKQIPEVQITVLEKEKMILSGRLHPLQKGWSPTSGLPRQSFRIDKKYYRNPGTSAPLVSVSEPFVCHGVPGVEITLCPFSYNPQKNVLTVIRKFKLTITMPDGISTIPALSSKTSHAYVKHLLTNYDVPLKKPSRSRGEEENYLIITAPEFEDDPALDSFTTFREETYTVSKVSTDDAGSSTDQIVSYLKNIYTEEGLTYVLFVGNQSNLPYFSSGPSSFWQYGLIDGDDDYTDVHVGVFCVRNAASLGNIVHKTIHTERSIENYPDTTTIYSTFIHEHMEMQCNYIRSRHWEPGGWKTSWMVPKAGSSENYTEDLKKQINSNNTRFVSYEGHGSSSGWQEGLDQGDVRNLTNREVYPFVWGYACSNGTFQNSSECFAETWIGAEGGAVMFTGASELSSSYQKALNVGMARGASHEDDLYSIGQIFDYGKTYVFDSTESIADDMQFVETVEKEGGSKMYNLFGDPACLVKYKGITESSYPENKSKKASQLFIQGITPDRISIVLPEQGAYSVCAYSVDGRRVAVLADRKWYTAGSRVIHWKGAMLAGGLYLVTLEGVGGVVTKRFVKVY